MPVLSFVSTKGGSGKTTGAVVLSSVLASAGGRVALIDADPNQPVGRWAGTASLPDTLTIVGDAKETNILEIIEEQSATKQFVIVDLEGSPNLSVTYAMSQSDLVIIPVMASQLDAYEASRTIKLVERQRKTTRAHIDCVIVWQRANPVIETGTAKHIRQQFEVAGIPILNTRLVEREAYKAIFSFGETLYSLTESQVRNLEKARENARLFAEEVVERLRVPAQ